MPSGGGTSGPSRQRSSLGPGLGRSRAEAYSDEESGDAIMEEGEPHRRAREEGCSDEEIGDAVTEESGPVPYSLAHIVAPILRAADEIEKENPRVAYLCRFTAWKKAHAMDPSASGRGVRRFKIQLTHRLEKEKRETEGRLASIDAKEIYGFCEQYCRKNLEGLQTRKPDEMAKYYQVASILIDVLKTVSPEKFHPEFDKYIKAVEKEKASFSRYNILPLNISGSTQPIMEIPEIKAAVELLRMITNLPNPKRDPTSVLPIVRDLLDWLGQTFGFQKGSVENQKEHLILLLANIQMRKGRNTHRGERYNHVIQSNTVVYLMKKLFQNYISWCRYLDLESNIKIPNGASTQQPELLYIGLYLLIWGEASNVRFMPECLCYIFHHMARGLYDIITSECSFDPPFRQEGLDDAFLHLVIQPIYNVIQKEAATSKHGTVSHAEWRNYDDLNEYFWSKKCFKQLGWPMDPRADFFAAAKKTKNETERHDHIVDRHDHAVSRRGMSKTNFVEVRTFLHLFRSFDRMWAFFILAFQAMVIIAWSPSGSLSAIFEPAVFRNVLTIFITSAFLNLLQATLELVLNMKAWRSLECSQMIRYILKFAAAIAWLIILPTTYSSCIEIPTGLVKFFSNWVGNFQSESIYIFAVALYMLPNIFSVLFFIFLPIRRAFERSNSRIVRFLLWWTQPKLYVARGMYEDTCSLLKYTSFWILLLICKLAFSYYVEISPLVGPTRTIMFLGRGNSTWQFFPYLQHTLGVVITVWAPIIMVYFMDTQIWYGIFSTLCGGVNGILIHLGEIQTLGMLKSRFEAIPRAFGKNLVPRHGSQSRRHEREEENFLLDDKFSDIWNAFINSLRDEDLISNRERYLLIFPSSIGDTMFRCPLFLLGGKIPFALGMAMSVKESDEELRKRIKHDRYVDRAVRESYETLLNILYSLIEEPDKEVVDRIRESIEDSIRDQSLLKEFRLDELPVLSPKIHKLLFLLLRAEHEEHDKINIEIANFLQDIMETFTRDIMKNGEGILKDENRDNQLFANLNLDSILSEAWNEKCVRLLFLLTTGESETYVPTNLEARHRITFFANSLFMKMPRAPQVRSMMSFSVLTPCFKEEVLFSAEDLHREDNGISILFYLRQIYPDEWKNFLERINFNPNYEDSLESKMHEIIPWASYRRQTLARTVRGTMYYRKALEIQCIQDKTDLAKLDRHRTMTSFQEGSAIVDMAQAIADIKFTYVISCQAYGMQKLSKYHHDKARYLNILNLMIMYPSLRVAYIDKVEAPTGNGTTDKTYYSVLVKGVDDKYDEEIYRIKLPGKPTNIGEERPENKNHAIIFTRGEALQAIDMNQDYSLEEAFKMRNVLEEFGSEMYGKSKPTILGLHKRIFPGSVSSLAWFMYNQETSFATIGQQVLANPLKVRFYYGHSDIFDRLFHVTRGGISKASKTINLSEDIFSGFNSTMREGNVTHHQYMQVRKGYDVGMNQISSFEAEVAIGNAEQTLSRDIYRLGRRFDFYRMLSLYFTTVGFYFSSMVTVLTVYIFLYGRLYLVMSGLEKSILLDPHMHGNIKPLDRALASQAVFQLGLMLVLPMFMEVSLEKIFIALVEFVIMQLQMASVFFTFQLGTKTHYYGRTILHGGAKYRPTGHEHVVYRAKFAEIYRMYSRSHFVKGLELLILLVVYLAYGSSYHSSSLHLFVTFSIWFLVASWLFAPFFFNPSCFEWQKTVDDWIDWRRWIRNQVGIGMYEEQSWEAWWIGEQEHLRKTSIRALLLEIILSLRFLIYQYVIVYHLNITRRSRSILVYAFSWLAMLTVLVGLKVVSIGRQKFEGLLFLGSVSVMVVLFVVCKLTICDFFAGILGFIPTGWCILLIGQACSPLLKKTMLWDSIMELARAYDYMMGLIIFLPIKLLSWFSFFSVIQTRLLFNQALGRGLKISRILAGQKDINEFE